jgi:3-oxoacyl-(acyl-carrier-protein) synthase
MEYAALAAIECWRDSDFPYDSDLSGAPDWDTGIVVGTGLGAIDVLTEVVGPLVAQRQHRLMGSRMVERVMHSGPAASVAGILGLGGPTITVSSACSSGTTAIHRAAQTLRQGICKRTLAGGVDIPSVHTAAMFDSMRVVCRDFNAEPERASRPLSATAGGFILSGGAGLLMLETLTSARERGVRIYAELAGSYENSGGQRGDGTMTAASSEGAVRCIQGAMADAGISPEEIDYINGHLTGTTGDVKEIRNLSMALGLRLERLPWINATKSMTGHALGAAGAIESIATVLQMNRGFLHPSINCGDLHPEIAEIAPRVPMQSTACEIGAALKTSFGFGDVNACLVFRRYEGSN